MLALWLASCPDDLPLEEPALVMEACSAWVPELYTWSWPRAKTADPSLEHRLAEPCPNWLVTLSLGGCCYRE